MQLAPLERDKTQTQSNLLFTRTDLLPAAELDSRIIYYVDLLLGRPDEALNVVRLAAVQLGFLLA